jgi:hypothetical protein
MTAAVERSRVPSSGLRSRSLASKNPDTNSWAARVIAIEPNWWQVARCRPARRRAPARTSSNPSLDSGAPRRGPFNTTKTRSVLLTTGRSSCR